jgi:hypothetical protein
MEEDLDCFEGVKRPADGMRVAGAPIGDDDFFNRGGAASARACGRQEKARLCVSSAAILEHAAAVLPHELNSIAEEVDPVAQLHGECAGHLEGCCDRRQAGEVSINLDKEVHHSRAPIGFEVPPSTIVRVHEKLRANFAEARASNACENVVHPERAPWGGVRYKVRMLLVDVRANTLTMAQRHRVCAPGCAGGG